MGPDLKCHLSISWLPHMLSDKLSFCGNLYYTFLKALYPTKWLVWQEPEAENQPWKAEQLIHGTQVFFNDYGERKKYNLLGSVACSAVQLDRVWIYIADALINYNLWNSIPKMVCQYLGFLACYEYWKLIIIFACLFYSREGLILNTHATGHDRNNDVIFSLPFVWCIKNPREEGSRE